MKIPGLTFSWKRAIGLTQAKQKIARATGMLNNEKFTSKAPAAKVQEEREKLASYTKMKEQVLESLAKLK